MPRSRCSPLALVGNAPAQFSAESRTRTLSEFELLGPSRARRQLPSRGTVRNLLVEVAILGAPRRAPRRDINMLLKPDDSALSAQLKEVLKLMKSENNYREPAQISSGHYKVERTSSGVSLKFGEGEYFFSTDDVFALYAMGEEAMRYSRIHCFYGSHGTVAKVGPTREGGAFLFLSLDSDDGDCTRVASHRLILSSKQAEALFGALQNATS